MSRYLALGAVAGPVAFTLAWLVLGFMSPGYKMWDIVVPSYSAISQPISGLGLGVTAPYMNAAFVLCGLALLVGVVGIVRRAEGIGWRTRWAVGALLALTPVGMMVDGLFTLESFFPHFLGYLLAVGGSVVSFFVAGRALRRDAHWRGAAYALPFASALTLVLFVIAQITFDPVAAGSNVGVAGLTERILITEVCAWFVLLGVIGYLPSRRRTPEDLVGVEPERLVAHRQLEA